ncbi:MAG: fibronectin type III domain-containing protein [Treponema sp.]|nr:fibronectin type III domain-containing protein [Treponema sp.]
MFFYYSRKIKTVLVSFVLGFFASVSFFATSITLGGSEGWSKLSVRRGVTEGVGRFGYSCIELATDSRTADFLTDVLIDFEAQPFKDAAGRYTVNSNALGISQQSVMGHGAALARGTGGISISGKHGTVFGSSGPAGSFYIEFWLCPSVAENGEIVFAWRSSRSLPNDILYQMIIAQFYRGHLEWTFTNLFDGYTGSDIVLAGITTIVPGSWTHHAISFNEENGCLEYRVDGMLEAIAYATSSTRDRGTVYPIFFGVPADIELCPKYTGLIDDFRIQKGVRDDSGQAENASGLRYAKYNVNGGRIETQPLLASTGATLESVVAVMSEPAETAVQLYVRSGENFFDWTDSYPAWQPIKSGEKISGVSGMYFQVAADLFPDGNGSTTPSITQLQIAYSELPEPLPPFAVRALPGNGSVTVSWNYSVDESTGGYLVYYGTRPGEYLGRVAKEGASPVDAGTASSLTLTGLRNGTIYYFAVATYSKYDSRILGHMSAEVYARPAAGE